MAWNKIGCHNTEQKGRAAGCEGCLLLWGVLQGAGVATAALLQHAREITDECTCCMYLSETNVINSSSN